MKSLNLFFINFIFFSSIFQIFISPLIIKFKISKFIIANCLCTLFFIFPFLDYFNEFNSNNLKIIVILGLLFFPITLIVIIFEYFNLLNKKNLILISFSPIIASTLMFIFNDQILPILVILHIFLYICLIYYFFRKVQNLQSKIIQVLSLFNILFLIFKLNSIEYIVLSIYAGLTSVLVFFILMFDYKKRISYYFKQMINLKELNNKLNHMGIRLKQSNDQYRRIILEKDIELLQTSRHASLAEITTGISHELAQPLTGIKGISQNMIDDIYYNEFENELAIAELNKICSLVDKSTKIIDHIRNFSKKSGFSMKLIDMNKTILQAIDLINLQLKENNIEIIFEMDENIPNILGDNISLEQLIVNIVINSKDAIIEKQNKNSQTNGVITIKTVFENNLLKVIINDNGSGIPKYILPKIWSPFFTSKKLKHGTGIGLSISRKILRAHNAKVDLKSNSDGTTFIFGFPIYEENPPLRNNN